MTNTRESSSSSSSSSEFHTCNTEDKEQCHSPHTGHDGNFATQRSRRHMHLQKPVRGHPESNFRTGSGKRKFKSPRKGDNDEDNHETIAMIRQQLYGIDGPYDNSLMVNQTKSELRCSKTLLTNHKRCRDDYEDEIENAFSQYPAKKARIGSLDFDHLAVSPCGADTTKVKPVYGRPKSSLRKGSGKCRFKSPRKGDDDEDNHETLIVIRQQLYSPGGPYEYMMVNLPYNESHCSLAHRKRSRDDYKDEEGTAFSQQPSKKPKTDSSDFEHLATPERSGDMTKVKPVYGRPKSGLRKGSGKCRFKSPRKGDNDEDNHETTAMIRQQLYSPGDPYENDEHCSSQSWDDHKDEKETAFSRQPAKKPRFDFSDNEHRAVSGHSRANRDRMNMQATSSITEGSCIKQLKYPCERDDDRHKNFAMIHQQHHNPGSDLRNVESGTTQPSSSFLQYSIHKMLIHLTNSGGGGDGGNRYRTCRAIQSYLQDLAGIAANQPDSEQRYSETSFTNRVSLKRKFKSLRQVDYDEDDHESLPMIRQQLYGPGGPYQNRMVSQFDLSDLPTSSLDQQNTPSRNSSLLSLSSGASDENQASTSTANQAPETKACKQSSKEMMYSSDSD